jgi:hypothetical protein
VKGDILKIALRHQDNHQSATIEFELPGHAASTCTSTTFNCAAYGGKGAHKATDAGCRIIDGSSPSYDRHHYIRTTNAIYSSQFPPWLSRNSIVYKLNVRGEVQDIS